MAMAWLSNTWVRDWAVDFQVVEAPWHVELAQKYNRRKIKLQKKPKDGA